MRKTFPQRLPQSGQWRGAISSLKSFPGVGGKSHGMPTVGWEMPACRYQPPALGSEKVNPGLKGSCLIHSSGNKNMPFSLISPSR